MDHPQRAPVQSHYRPRTRAGWVLVLSFMGLFAFAQPPLVFWLANRTEPWVLGLPFFYAYLLIVYVVLIAVLLVALWKGL